MSSTPKSAVTASPQLASLREWVQVPVLFILIAILYGSILANLVGVWATDANYSHGFFVPAFAAWVIWRERKNIRNIQVKPSWIGLLVIAGSLVLFIVGVLGAEAFLSRVSLLFLLAGLTIYFFGWRQFRSLLFPWAVLFLMIPIPAIIFNEIALPLQFLASRLAADFLSICGVPVLREGNVIHLPAITLEVVEACSGIRSLVSLITLSVIYGYFFEPRVWRRILLIAAATPIAVLANALRIMATGLLGTYWDPSKSEGVFHAFSGWVIFMLSLLLLFGFHRAYTWTANRLERRSA